MSKIRLISARWYCGRVAKVATGGRFFEQLSAFEIKSTGVAIWPYALVIAWLFDYLFWGRAPGVSFPTFVIIVLAFGYWISRSARVAVATSAKWLLVPIILFAMASAVRAEPLTMILDYLVVVGLLGVLADSLSSGGWPRYRLTNYLVAYIHVVLAGLVGGGALMVEARAKRSAGSGSARSYRPILRGVLLAVPVLVIFGLLFASADPIFSRIVTSPFDSLDDEALAEYAFRLLYILILAYALAGVFLHAARARPSEGADSNLQEEKNLRLLGPVEGQVVLGAINLLFVFFVVIQFRYFFAGSRAITERGMTYSEYARRGFAELVVVAILTLLLLLGLSLLGRRESPREKTIFSALSSGLVILTSIILVSAFQRLLLYEDAYGFTRLRTYSHGFMVWLALVLVAVLVLQWRNVLHRLALVLLIATLGFVASLNVLGVDSFIAKSNVKRAIKGAELDVDYLDQLSADATPALIDGVDDLPREGRESLSRLLVCQSIESSNTERPWQSFHLSA